LLTGIAGTALLVGEARNPVFAAPGDPPLSFTCLHILGRTTTIRFNEVFGVLFGRDSTRLLSNSRPELGRLVVRSADPRDYIVEYTTGSTRTGLVDAFEIQAQNSAGYRQIRVRIDVRAAMPALDLFRNPFNKWSAHHRPIGAGALAGPPGGTANPLVANPVYDVPGPLNARGRLANVKAFRCGASQQGRKYTYRVTASDPQRTIREAAGAPENSKLAVTLRMPAGVDYPSTTGDDVIQVWPRNGGAADIGDLFFNFEGRTGSAKRRYEYPFGGSDIPDGTDGWDRGSSASGLRFPGTVLRGFEINPASPAPIRHALNVTATRHSNEGAPASAHVLSKKRVWPAMFMDGGASSPDQNLGDLPYGTRIFIRWQDRLRRNTLGLSARGLILFDTFLYFGCYIIDGQGQHVNGGGVLQLRIDQDVTAPTVDDVDRQLMKLLPLLYPLRNPRRHNAETEVHGDGLPYAGGGGPLDAGSLNTAWDA
jgi:hypothetical protein